MKKIGRGIVRYFKNTDLLLIGLCAVCSAYSVLLLCGVYTSGMSIIRVVQMQLFSSFLGLVAAIGVSTFDYRLLAKLWKLYYPVAIGLVVLTFFFGEQ